MATPNRPDIEEASKRIAPFIRRTPVHTSLSINDILGCNLYFKCENFQKVGAFKFRGAMNAVNQLTEKELQNGVATHSSGNHAQALALAAKLKGVKAYIVMPNNAPKSKREAVLGYGADVIECEPTLEARETTLRSIVQEKNACFIHPYNDVRIIAGQATCAMELIEEINDLEYIVAPVGGGGLLSGTALAVRYFADDTKTIGAEPTGADDAFRSFQAGKIIPSSNPNTIADGLLTSLGSLTFPLIKKYVNNILTIEDAIIAKAMKLIWQRMKIIVEPSAAVPLAAVMDNKQLFKNKKIGIILSGGNVDFDKLPF
jgi:threonine dehydratase